jgi:hypothetical protein
MPWQKAGASWGRVAVAVVAASELVVFFMAVSKIAAADEAWMGRKRWVEMPERLPRSLKQYFWPRQLS